MPTQVVATPAAYSAENHWAGRKSPFHAVPPVDCTASAALERKVCGYVPRREAIVLTSRYMTSVKNLAAIMNKIIEGTAPEKFTIAHLKGLGFKSSNDQGVLPLLKDLGFLSADGAPTHRYHEYRDRSKSKAVLGQALHEAYADLFHINERPSDSDRAAIEGKFKSVHNATDRIAKEQAKTFFALLDLADLDTKHQPKKLEKEKATKETKPPSSPKSEEADEERPRLSLGGLRYNIEIHLPATKDPEVFNAIFKSLKEHLLED